jgi:hypothetical protein
MPGGAGESEHSATDCHMSLAWLNFHYGIVNALLQTTAFEGRQALVHVIRRDFKGNDPVASFEARNGVVATVKTANINDGIELVVSACPKKWRWLGWARSTIIPQNADHAADVMCISVAVSS